MTHSFEKLDQESQENFELERINENLEKNWEFW